MPIKIYDKDKNLLYMYYEYGFEISYGEQKLTLANGTVFYFSEIKTVIDKEDHPYVRLVMA